MKKIVAFSVLVFMLCLAQLSMACQKPQPVGASGNANNPPTGFITAISTSGHIWTVTYAGSVQTTVNFTSPDIYFVGSWSGTKIASIGTGGHVWPDGSGGSIGINGGTSTIEVHHAALLGGSHNFAAPGGMTGITGLGLGQSNFTIDGVDNTTSHHWTYGIFNTASGCTFSTPVEVGDSLFFMQPPREEKLEWWQAFN